MKWYEVIFMIIITILLSPFIIIVLLFLLIASPFIAINNRIVYKKSPYYNEFKIPYNKNILSNPNYNLYNYISREKLAVKYVKQPSNSFEYFIYNNEILILPDFNEISICNDEDNTSWVVFMHNQEESIRLEEYINSKISLLEDRSKPVKIVISRNIFDVNRLDLESLPKEILVIRNYDSIFSDEKDDALEIIPWSTNDLYEMMLKNDNLGGHFELKDDTLIWEFEEIIYEIGINESSTTIQVFRKNKFKTEITHWHPCNEEIYDDICNIGEKGNIIVIKKTLNGESIVYMGKKENCTYDINKKRIGKIYCFESK